MRLLKLDNQTVDLISVQQRLLGHYSHLLIDMCSITDRLVPPCRFSVFNFSLLQTKFPTEASHVMQFCTSNKDMMTYSIFENNLFVMLRLAFTRKQHSAANV